MSKLNKKILVVDDDEVVQMAISIKLKAAGYDVISATDGTIAVTAARSEKPDAIVLDINFPDDFGTVAWDGYRIMEWLKRLDKGIQTPILVISSSDPQQVEIRISGRQLTLEPVHVGRELLHRRARDSRADVRFEADRNLQRPRPARERARAVQRERQRRIRALFPTAKRTARLIAKRINRDEVAHPRWRAVRPPVAHEVTVNPREPHGCPRGKPIDDLVNVCWAEVTATRRRQRHRTEPVVRNHARSRMGIEGRRDKTQRRNENDTQQG